MFRVSKYKRVFGDYGEGLETGHDTRKATGVRFLVVTEFNPSFDYGYIRTKDELKGKARCVAQGSGLHRTCNADFQGSQLPLE